ncbi:hypothetical protein ALMP_50050 [Streptomyces sp. A012304]|nr:serine/threonine-protein kinase [Streptomyces sp. A012304]GKQ38474.1 hypothetical protein ALMP_50050 [Streptomyces sp. A012304]
MTPPAWTPHWGSTRYATAGVTGSKLKFLAADHHGTSSLALDATTLAFTKRYTTPFGTDRGTPLYWPWPDDKGFLGKTRDTTTGLTHIGARLGGGGFGAVFEAEDTAGEKAAVKLVPKAPGTEREMLFIDLDGVRNVVPVIDSGEHEDQWVLVMPRAKKSLRDHLQEHGRLSLNEAVAVLSDVAEALADLKDREIVHRDLKPENILLFGGRWCLADFGIARYAEATTVKHTFKFHGTFAYMAPESWNNQRATSASDIYALGVLAYALLEGTPPFTGPYEHDFQDQHLHGALPPLTTAPPLLAAL